MTIKRYENIDIEKWDVGNAAVLCSDAIYGNSDAADIVEKNILRDERGITFVDYDERDVQQGVFQCVPLGDVMYFSMGVVCPDSRSNGVYSKSIDLRLAEAEKAGCEWVILRTANPLVVEIYGKRGFLPQIPKLANGEQRLKAQQAVSDYTGLEVDINEFMVADGKTLVTHGFEPKPQSSNEPEINDYLKEHLDKKNGDRLVLIKKI